MLLPTDRELNPAPPPRDTMTPPIVAILAGGLATRMLPATATTPKSMLPVAGEPFIAHQLRSLARQGMREVVLCCGHLHQQIETYVGDGSRFGVSVRYALDGGRLLGTGGALRKALPLLGPRFAVLYGDSYLPAPLLPAWHAFLESGKQALMTVLANRDRWDTSNVLFQAGRLLCYLKSAAAPPLRRPMRHIDYGFICLESAVLAAVPQPRFDLASLLEQLSAENQLAGFEVHQRFYEIGSPAGLAETHALLAAARQVETAP